MERTFVMIKPEAIQRNITSQILKHFEPLELSIIGMKMMRPPQSLFDEHYIEFKNEYFFQAMVEGLVTRGPVIAICFLGNSAVKKVRTLLGLSHPLHSPLGTYYIYIYISIYIYLYIYIYI